MDLGCVCIDMGGGSTSAAVWGGRSLLHIESLNVGGDHVTSDIARGLSTSKAGAERLKTLHGSAMASANEDREMLEAPPRGEDASAGPVIVPRAMLKTVIAPRVEETLELLRDRLKAAGVGLEPGAGMVLTGGASQLAGGTSDLKDGTGKLVVAASTAAAPMAASAVIDLPEPLSPTMPSTSPG